MTRTPDRQALYDAQRAARVETDRVVLAATKAVAARGAMVRPRVLR